MKIIAGAILNLILFSHNFAGVPPASSIKIPEGFKIELIKEASPAEGSWGVLSVDAAGRLYLSSDQPLLDASCSKNSKWGGIWRATTDENGAITQWSKVPVPIGMCQGMHWLGNTVMFTVGLGPDGHGIYRCKDTDVDGELDQWELLKRIPLAAGEDGCHGIVSGPGGIYFALGKGVPLIDGIDSASPCQHYEEASLLPPLLLPGQTKATSKAPYGHILRCDAEGKKWELYCTGLNNPRDLEFSDWSDWPELFTFDADSHDDLGLPWHRPARILNLLAGGDYGFRSNAAALPVGLPDVAPAADPYRRPSVVPVGSAIPSGIKSRKSFAYWPAYERATFFGDWQGGRILTYTFYHYNKIPSIEKLQTLTEFIQADGLHVSDIEFTPDGNMWFTVGGRGEPSGLYRVSPERPHPPRPQIIAYSYSFNEDYEHLCKLTYPLGAKDREFVWSMLTNSYYSPHGNDLALRSRLLLERYPFTQWGDDGLLSLRTVERKSSGLMMALVRCGDRKTSDRVLPDALSLLPREPLPAIRIINTAIARQGFPEAKIKQGLISTVEYLLKQPAAEIERNKSRRPPEMEFLLKRELTQTLACLQAPQTVALTLGLLVEAQHRWAAAGIRAPDALQLGPQEEQLWYALVLSTLRPDLFTAPQRAVYFHWFDTVALKLKGGKNLPLALQAIRSQAMSKLPPELQKSIDENRTATMRGQEAP